MATSYRKLWSRNLSSCPDLELVVVVYIANVFPDLKASIHLLHVTADSVSQEQKADQHAESKEKL